MAKEPKLEFKDKQDKRSAKEDFQNLLNHPAWQRIVEYFDNKTEYLEKVINGDIKDDDGKDIIKDIHDLKRYQDKRNMAIQFRNLPEILIGFEELDNAEPIELDPFEKDLTRNNEN